ncbi:DNA-3-methyladenine glycosylase family protein [Pseudoroseicyclus aestuarii]|uniref:DNA-3-methyladenine glycosylase II n=1 Tax=Pseudoroseicyclus aestuarii TaxID=1795041 RepID=A0A318T6Z0_9RHOB|nr:DNA-3-methyladenine glycosylase [Pseudoroseicyclus aestuarii]PYE86244.1 DNA-3-methyladenine glycosylase II [Pseudoroseicyclus aestuarii]
MTGRIIRTEACLAEGADWLLRAEPRFAPALEEALPLRLIPDGFDALAGAITAQQVSTASAAAIRARMQAAGLTHEAAIRGASDADLRAVGLSRPKMRYLRALAEARLDYAALRDTPTEAVLTQLTAVPGIGLWTAEIYAMFALGRADVFAAGDLALREAARLLLDLPERPGDKDLRRIAADWSPWRSVAARALWAYYRQRKGREGSL